MASTTQRDQNAQSHQLADQASQGNFHGEAGTKPSDQTRKRSARAKRAVGPIHKGEGQRPGDYRHLAAETRCWATAGSRGTEVLATHIWAAPVQSLTASRPRGPIWAVRLARGIRMRQAGLPALRVADDSSIVWSPGRESAEDQ